MSVLSYDELVQLVADGVITNVKPEQINGTSIDLTLGPNLMVEYRPQNVSLQHRQPLDLRKVTMGEKGWFIGPGEFLLAESEQVFYLPNDLSAEYKLKSSMARIGLEHMNAGWCDPGWNGSVLTLEFKNLTQFHGIHIRPGDRIGQVVFFRCKPVPMENSYAKRGNYNGCLEVSGARLK